MAIEPITSTSLAVTWNEVPLAGSYEVSSAEAADFTDASSTTVTDPTATRADLKKQTTYFVRVRALAADGEPLSDWSSPASAETPESLPLRVATWNVLCENCSKGKASWAKRRGL